MSTEKDDIYTSFLGTGWSFPPTFSKVNGSVGMVSDEKDIEESLAILFSTVAGERFLQPTYGCNLNELLFEPMSTTLKTYVKGLIEQAVLLFEPRVIFNDVSIDTSNELEGRLDLGIDYTVRATNSRFNLVFHFYKSEGAVR
jgi:phage baseplate assembly protein W